jgi:CDP-glycerol glycerophosphotransferase (TagB/SpsB family)
VRAVLRAAVRLVPRRPSLVAFGAQNDRFADNAAYLYLHMAQNSPLDCVWVSGSADVVETLRRAGLRAERRWSPRGVLAAARASCFVFNGYRSDVNRWLSDGAVAVNLWHGVGIKRIQRNRAIGAAAAVYAAPEGSLVARVFADDRQPPDYVLSTAPLMTDNFSTAFDVPRERCPELGYPRNDHLLSGSAPPSLLVDDGIAATLAQRRPVVAYLPTWRDNALGLPVNEKELLLIAETVARQGGVLLFKAHEASVVDLPETADILVLPRDADVTAYLGFCDALITDYSSVAYDFLLLDRPIALFVPDLDDYLDDRGLLHDPLTHMAGVIYRDVDSLCAGLENVHDLPLHDFPRLKRLFWGDAEPGAAARVTDLVSAASAGGRP